LAALAARIRTLLRQNGRDTRERARLDAQLASAERARAAARARLADTTRQIADAEARQHALTARRAQAAEALASSRERLADALRAAYQLSFDGPLKRLLDQASPLEGERLATYYGYFG